MIPDLPYLGVFCRTCKQDCLPDDKGRCMWCQLPVVRWKYASYKTPETARVGANRARAKGLPALVEGLCVWVEGERAAA